ncbi:hypothetical protein CALVIDRAFT_186922 [Calocera viscosa TUFC12733]|uniref:Uncharacterized protein n=1 Tax=Calocera viscosa (strain TUFC12733) TaxID=1330018 RepID=A0A167KU60_CALVF|nr:hypothetical protein CALVIDRAFT_186922 [Calocera viscosa TUFC12733]
MAHVGRECSAYRSPWVDASSIRMVLAVVQGIPYAPHPPPFPLDFGIKLSETLANLRAGARELRAPHPHRLLRARSRITDERVFWRTRTLGILVFFDFYSLAALTLEAAQRWTTSMSARVLDVSDLYSSRRLWTAWHTKDSGNWQSPATPAAPRMSSVPARRYVWSTTSHPLAVLTCNLGRRSGCGRFQHIHSPMHFNRPADIKG